MQQYCAQDGQNDYLVPAHYQNLSGTNHEGMSEYFSQPSSFKNNSKNDRYAENLAATGPIAQYMEGQGTLENTAETGNKLDPEFARSKRTK